MCVALLVTKNALSLDDEIQEHVPELPKYDWPVTLRHLLHHTSGMPDYMNVMLEKGIKEDQPCSAETVLEGLKERKLGFEPGEKMEYSNSGYFLMSFVVRNITGKSLRAYAKENIFDPLGMTNSHFHDRWDEPVDNEAIGYINTSEGIEAIQIRWDSVGDGGLFTTVEDLFLWNENFDHNILGDEALHLTLTPGRLNDGSEIDYALGHMIQEYRGMSVFHHSGSFGGFKANMLRFPEKQASVVCLANIDTLDAKAITYAFADVYVHS